MTGTPYRLLAADEPAPVTVHNENGRSPLLIVADHAGNSIPRALGRLGVPESEFGAPHRLGHWHRRGFPLRRGRARRHFGAAELFAPGHRLQPRAGVRDINPRDQRVYPDPGNVGLSESPEDARLREIFQPYHDRIKAELDRRWRAGRPAALIAMHSFTPIFMGAARPWHAGVLYNRDARFADLLIASLRREDGLIVGDNEPYSVTDESDYTIPVHGERRGLLHVEVEIRQDLIAPHSGQRAWGALLARLLPQAYQALGRAERSEMGDDKDRLTSP